MFHPRPMSELGAHAEAAIAAFQRRLGSVKCVDPLLYWCDASDQYRMADRNTSSLLYFTVTTYTRRKITVQDFVRGF